MRKVGIVGAGASGMMAAIAASRAGAKVILFERNDRIGKKILSTGNGKCNLTNIDMNPAYFHGEHPEFARRILNQFSLKETLELFLEMGIYTRNRNGCLYPNSEQAQAVLDALRFELRRLDIPIRLNSFISDIRQKGNKYVIAGDGIAEECDAVIISCGSRAYPVTGSDGSGYKLCKKLGIPLIKPLPALTQCFSELNCFKGLSGIRCDGMLTTEVNGICLEKERGEIQFTDKGISGIVTFQLSGKIARALEQKKQVNIHINFLPDFDHDKLITFISKRIRMAADKTAEEGMIGLFHKKLIPVLLKEARIRPGAMCDQISFEKCELFCDVISDFIIPVSSVKGFETSQTCSGGVDTSCLTESLEVEHKKGIYVTGELIDIDGPCGGYNLQWAWSTGYIAGRSAAND